MRRSYANNNWPFFGPSLHIFSSDAMLKIVKNRNSYFGLLSLSRMASLLFGPGKGMAESVSSYQNNLTAFALLTRLLSQMDAILD